MQAAFEERLAEAKARERAKRAREREERTVDWVEGLPPIRGSTRRQSKSLSWSGTRVEGKGSIGLLSGTTMVQLRTFSPIDVHSVSKHPDERRFEFTVGSGTARIYFALGPGEVPSILVEAGETRVVRTSMVEGDYSVGFFVEAVGGPVKDLRYTVGP